MGKYLFVLAMIFALAIYVAIQDQRAATKSAEQRTPPANPTISTEAHDNHSQKDAHNAKWNSPRWYKLFAWPEGITTWAIILTLLAVAEQARESAKATKAVRDSIPHQKNAADAALLNAQAVINSERPWVMVQTEVLPQQNSAKALFKLKAFNYGKSPAHILNCKGPKAELIEGGQTLPIPPEYGVWDWDKTFLAPKDGIPLGDLIDPWQVYKAGLGRIIEEGRSISKDSFIVVYGLIEYSDGIAPKTYKTAFCYSLKRELPSDMGGTLIPCGPPEYNAYT